MEILVMIAIAAATLGLIWLIVREPIAPKVFERPTVPLSAFAKQMAEAEDAEEARLAVGLLPKKADIRPQSFSKQVERPVEKPVDKPKPKSYSSSSSRSSSGGSSYSSRSDDSYSSYSSWGGDSSSSSSSSSCDSSSSSSSSSSCD
ncbi:hypothetical protein PJKIFABJ_00034 [Pseudomonas phage PE09]|uniref:Uncharacterized protein n=2 Tax=Otagovirus TaxID=2560197 RepID=A0A7S7YBU4_9CAUD|nr:hypothetical protein QGX22_gp034 [Pseudomonas phage PE09]YP_010768339.1 hypothetical protein QGX23_gp031 [Pseudomonas phage PN09]QHZ59989.1 hypothetical protein PJKIFABJ_00034 [Pseudomonas phage PE09]QPB10452.1 hypothetical protein PN09_031 [Pseudomonas phage PN09]